MIRIIVYWGLYWGSLVLRNYHIAKDETLIVLFAHFTPSIQNVEQRAILGWTG